MSNFRKEKYRAVCVCVCVEGKASFCNRYQDSFFLSQAAEKKGRQRTKLLLLLLGRIFFAAPAGIRSSRLWVAVVLLLLQKVYYTLQLLPPLLGRYQRNSFGQRAS